jgi:aminocarboxymuconate-semialdehyde decarboxylase
MRFKIDADSHYLDPDVFEFVEENYKKKLPSFNFDNDQKLAGVNFDHDPNPHSVNPLPLTAHNTFSGLSDIRSRLNDFEKLGINFQILNPQEHPMRFSYLVEQNLAKQMAYSYNRNIKKIVDKHSDKVKASLILPLQDMDWSLKEIAWGKENNFDSVIIDTSWPDENYLAGYPLVLAPGFDEFCKLCESLDMTINIHGAMHHLGHRTQVYKDLKLNRLFPGHHKIALISFVTSGILDRYPNLKIILSEGMMKYIIPSYTYLNSVLNKDCKKYFKTNFWFTTEFEQKKELIDCVKIFGADRFLFATDYPHDDEGGEMKLEDHRLIDNMVELTDEEKDLICYKNSVELFKLDFLKV